MTENDYIADEESEGKDDKDNQTWDLSCCYLSDM